MKGCTFSVDGRLIRQVEGYPAGDLISVVLSNIFCVKMKPDVVKPLKPKRNKRYVDDIHSKRIKYHREKSFKKLNNYHLKIKFTIVLNPSKFLDMEIMTKNGIIETSVAINESRYPITSHQQFPKEYSRDAMLRNLHRAL